MTPAERAREKAVKIVGCGLADLTQALAEFYRMGAEDAAKVAEGYGETHAGDFKLAVMAGSIEAGIRALLEDSK